MEEHLQCLPNCECDRSLERGASNVRIGLQTFPQTRQMYINDGIVDVPSFHLLNN